MAQLSEDDLRQRVRQLLADCDPAEAGQFAFRGEQFDRGLALVHFPEGKGGLGLEPRAQTIVNDELRKADRFWHDLNVNPIGIGMGMPVVLAHGSEEHHLELLRPCFTGEEIWCQLFSEPGAGSDVAGLASRAIRDGDEWIVNGQKVWTTLAHVARWGMLVARTDPDQPKHKGMTYFLMDMQAPGVEVRPLYQITGEAEFNEVFMSDLRIPDDMRISDVGDGWRVAITTLMNERVALSGGAQQRGAGPISVLKTVWDKQPGNAVMRDRVTRLWIEAEVLRLTNARAKQNAATGTPGPEGSVGKLMSAELNKRIYEACVDVMGADAMIHEPGYPMTRPGSASLGPGEATKGFLRSRANSIEGGTSEVMRNILGERVLGLPKEPQVDVDIPWAEIPRS